MTLSLIGMLALAFNIQPVEANGTIYIRADGSVDPPTAPIQRDGDIYTLTDNITSVGDGIVIERNNMTLDGAGHTMKKQYIMGCGIGLSLRSNVTVKRFNIQNYNTGLALTNSSGNYIIGNNITNVYRGIELRDSSNWNSIIGNIISRVDDGLSLYESSNNIVRSNIMSNNTFNFHVYGRSIAEFTNDVDVSNIVEGRPVYYWVNSMNGTVPLNAGYVALVNCTRILAQNLSLSKNGHGVLLAFTTDSTISKNTLMNNTHGIDLRYSTNNTIVGNNITSNKDTGIFLEYSSNNTITQNNITASKYTAGIDFYTSSSNNTITENNITNNKYGIILSNSSSNNTIFHNSFINNTSQVYTYSSTNTWDNGYPSGGNYWSDYIVVANDTCSGPFQDEIGSDGIGDTVYIIDANNTDNYPLMGMFSDFNATSEHHIQTICNSTISDFQFNGTVISFNASGENGTSGFCRICVPTTLMNDTYKVFVNGTEIPHTLLPCSNSTHNYLYFTYSHSTQEVIIIPEFPSLLILSLFMMATLLAVIVYKRKHQTRNKKKFSFVVSFYEAHRMFLGVICTCFRTACSDT